MEQKFWERVEQFQRSSFEKSLKTHKLSGKLKDLWSFSIEYDVRVIFYFAEEDKAIFINIGTHDVAY